MKKAFLTFSAIALLSIASIAQKQSDPNCLKELNQNKKVVLAFYQQVFGDKDLSHLDKYLLPTYIQHNPHVADGAAAFEKAAGGWLKGAPKTKIDVQHIAADGDLVFIHLKDKLPNGNIQSVIDIFRMENGKIAEHWDVHESVPEKSANSHPMF